MRPFFACAAALFALSTLSGAATARSTSRGDALENLQREVTFGWAKLHPMNATDLGISGEDAQLDELSPASRARDLALIRTWERTLSAIPLSGATPAERDDALLLRAQLTGMERALTVYRFDEKDYSAAASAIVNTTFTLFERLPVTGQNGATDADVERAWDDLIARLEKAPAYIDGGRLIATTPGRLFGIVGSQDLAGGIDFFNDPLSAAAKAQLSPAGFARFARARDAVTAKISETKRYIDAHDASWPENFAIGRSAYDAMLRDEQLLPFSSDDLVRMGRDELAHGWAEQAWLEHLATVRGTPLGAATGGGMAPAGDALIPYYRDLIAQLRAFVVANGIVTVPDWLGTIEVVETPKFRQATSPGASMDAPRRFSKETGGFYYITPVASFEDAAKRLDLYEDFDRDRIWSTAAHEAMPGHFLQLSIARRNPDFIRSMQDSGVFAEGWAFYGEEMLVRLGLYGDDLDGRLDIAQWERIRGARAIVDPLLAAGVWSFDRAVTFFEQQTGATHDEAKNAVAGIALGPGYVISYTAGRYQLETLLAEYERRMGSRASLLDFHDRLLSYGTAPFAVVAPELLGDLDKPVEVVRAAANY